METSMMHCAICRNGSESCIITMYISGINIYKKIIIRPFLSQNMMSGAQSAGNQRPTHIARVSSLVGTSETTRATPFTSQFCQWLAGLIDGDGSLKVSKAGHTSCEITIGFADLVCLRYLQDKLGGTIKPRSGEKALRWRLHNKQGMINTINSINGHIRHSARQVQLHRVCQVLHIAPLRPAPSMDTYNAWFAGNFDAEGTVTLNNTNNQPQLTISVTNKHYSDVQPYMDTFGGDIYFNSSQNGYYKWTVQSRVDVLAMLGYFKQCSPHSFKKQRLILMNSFYQLYDLRAFIPESIHHSAWQQFVNKWNAKI